MKEKILQKLSEHGYKKTTQRVAVLDVLIKQNSPLSVAVIHEKTKIDIVTIYRIIHMLVTLGLVIEETIGNEHFYHICMDNHAHIVCIECHRIFDTSIKYTPPKTNKHFTTIYQHVTFQGICKQCS